MQRPQLSAVLLCTLVFAANCPSARTAPNDAPMGGSGTLSVSGYEDAGPSGSSITVAPTGTLNVSPATSITASTQSTVPSPSGIKARRTNMAVYSSTTAVSETIEPMSDDVPDKTSLVTKAHFLAFIIIPILSFVFVIMVIVLIVGIVKLKKGDRHKSKVIKSPDKIEADVVHGDQDSIGPRTQTIGSRVHVLSVVSGPEPVSDPSLAAAEFPIPNAYGLSVGNAGFGETVPTSTTVPEVLEADLSSETTVDDGVAVPTPTSESYHETGATQTAEVDYEASSGLDGPTPNCSNYSTLLPEPDSEHDDEDVTSEIYDEPASPGPVNRTDSDYEDIWSDADYSRPPSPNYEGIYDIPGPRTLPRGVVPGEEYDDIVGPEGQYCAPPTTELEIYGELKQRNCFTIDRENISILDQCGCGQFATVYKGAWCEGSKMTEVAVKTLSVDASIEKRIMFLQEAHVMSQFCHPNIVQLFGVIAEGNPKMIVMEMMPHGDLRKYLMSLIPPPGKSLSRRVPALLLRFSQDVANGMKYLSLKGYIHRDLAARNILLSADYTCKIADFGLSRDVANDEIYQSRGGLIPLRWTAPEAIASGTYSTATDVWSYGILLYEIWSLGKRPYGEMKNNEILSMQHCGQRLHPPPGCPKPMYAIMIDCWHPEPPERPDFFQIDCFLRKKNEDLLWVVPESTEGMHPHAHVIGTELVCGSNLYPTLQGSYCSPT